MMSARTSCAAAAVLLVITAAAAAPAKLPPEMKTCKQTDTQYNECLKNALQSSLPMLFKGIRSLDTQPLDPLSIVEFKISEEKGKPVAIDFTFSDVNITGIANSIIDSFEMIPGSYDLKITAHTTAPMTLRGNYQVDGKILLLPIQGNGKCKIAISDPTVELILKGAPLEKDGNTYFDVQDVKFSMKTERLYFDLTNLFNGDKALGDNMNKFLNDNWREITDELGPSIEEGLSLAFKDISNHLFHKVPYNDIFSPK